VQQTKADSWKDNNRNVFRYTVVVSNSAPILVNPVLLTVFAADAAKLKNLYNLDANGTKNGQKHFVLPTWQNGIAAHGQYNFEYISYDSAVTFAPSVTNVCTAPPAPVPAAAVCGLTVTQKLTSSWSEGGRTIVQYEATVHNDGNVAREAWFTVTTVQENKITNIWNLVDAGVNSWSLPSWQTKVAKKGSYSWGYQAYDGQVDFAIDQRKVQC